MSRQEEVEPGQGSLVWAEFLPEEGVLLLRVLTPEEVFRLIYGSIGQTMEIKLSTLRDELSPEIVDNAIQGIVQGLTGESESSSRSPLTPQKGKLCRSAMWEKIKQLYHKLNLFEPSMGGACGMKLPTPKLKRPKRKGRQKKASEKKTSEPDLEEEEEEEQVTGCFLRFVSYLEPDVTSEEKGQDIVRGS
ncbi:uncharacterized protein LOC112151879 [Oryzias melastigma]|uniref:uncharacterized protein LOC112151879 n=1 Tax=Oryzias melastigma TaxID=30732 RepID=UPI000CF7FE7B|nr:uncharacterized protein LOC112151879 [Oryzias melastigma]